MRIYLIGYKCCGKSTIGPILAEKLGFELIDLDSLIEERHGKSIPELFITNDEINFRKMERDAFFEIMKTENIVVATGGGFPCWFNNMELLKRSGIVVFLKVDPRNLYYRMKRIAQERPVLKGRTGLALKWHINKMLRKYGHIYYNAHIVHENNTLNADTLVHKIKLYKNALIHNLQ
ncbi:MAG: shikimate kinase [Bacteroidales bacterium]